MIEMSIHNNNFVHHHEACPDHSVDVIQAAMHWSGHEAKRGGDAHAYVERLFIYLFIELKLIRSKDK